MGDVSISPPSIDALNSHVAAVTSKIMLISMIVMCFLVAFCFFLCLYARWYWSRSEDSYVVSWRGVIARQGTSAMAAAQRRGLDRDTLGLLPVVVYDPKEFKEGMECSVCLSEVSLGEKVRVLPKCSHGFHLECIDMWFMSHSTCPLCRTTVISPKRQLSGCNQELPEVGANRALSGSDSSSELESDSNTHSEEVMGLPTNVLLCGNEVEARSVGEASGSSNNRQRNELVIEIPRELCDDCSSSPPSTARLREEEVKTPMVSRLSSLKRMMSRGRRVAPSSSTMLELS